MILYKILINVFCLIDAALLSTFHHVLIKELLLLLSGLPCDSVEALGIVAILVSSMVSVLED